MRPAVCDYLSKICFKKNPFILVLPGRNQIGTVFILLNHFSWNWHDINNRKKTVQSQRAKLEIQVIRTTHIKIMIAAILLIDVLTKGTEERWVCPGSPASTG